MSADAGVTARITVQPPTRARGRLGIFVNARLLRLLIGVGLVASAAWYIYLYAFNKVSIAGVVNAPLLTVVSQIDGRINHDVAAQGQAVNAGGVLALVTNDRVDDRTVVELGRSLDAAREKLSALRTSIDDLDRLGAALARRGRDYQAAMGDHLEQEVKEQEASLASARNSASQASDALRRGTALIQQRTISRVAYDDLAYAHQRATAEAARTGAQLVRTRYDLASAREGVFLGDNNSSDVPYSRQRQDEVDIRLAGVHNDERALVATIAELEAKYRAEAARTARMSSQELVAPVEGVVWRSTVAQGTEIIRGAPLFQVIDCRHVYIEATTRERFFEALRPGDRVRVELEGSGTDLSGSIRGVVGPGASLDATPNLSVISRRNGTEAQLIIDIDAGALPVMPGTTCNVGRSAKVYFN
jgi:multidrug resistance efflux pump